VFVVDIILPLAAAHRTQRTAL